MKTLLILIIFLLVIRTQKTRRITAKNAYNNNQEQQYNKSENHHNRYRETGNKIYTFSLPSGVPNSLFSDALNQPHLLVAGATGSGKSVLLNGLISNILLRFPLDQTGGANMILIDPKRVELSAYKNLPHTLYHAGGQHPDLWAKALKAATSIMDERYDSMERRGLKKYDGSDIYVIIDEWASVFKGDLAGKPCYKAVVRLTSEGRAARVHVILATQVPKASIIPTEIRENIIARFALMTNSATESRVIMGDKGCETLPDPQAAGYASGYYCKPPYRTNTRLCACLPYVRQAELDRLIQWWEDQYFAQKPLTA